MSVTDLSSRELDPKTYFYSVGGVLALLFALLDNNQSGMALPFLLALWLFQSLLPVSVLMLCQQRLQQIRWLHHWSPWLKLLLSGLAASLIFAGPALLLDIAAGLDPMQHDWQSWLLAWGKEVMAIAPLVTLGWTAANAPWILGWRLTKPEPQEQVESAATALLQPSERQSSPVLPLDDGFQSLCRQLPAERRGTVLYMKSELHYLMVVTDKGRTLILSSLKDAIAELPPAAGFQPHRSYWVSRSAVKKLSRQGRQGQLILSDDSRIPVSRQQLAAVTALLQHN